MVIGLFVISAIPTVTGVSLGVSEQRKENERKNDARRMAKFNIDVHAPGDTYEDSLVDGKRLVLRDYKVYLDNPHPTQRTGPPSHTAESFFIDYPELDETKHLKRGFGLVTTISDDPPMLGWIYADKDTYELKYGNRTQSVEHLVGPWDWTEDERVLTLEENIEFVAVEEEEGGPWALYYDRDGDDLEGVLEEQGKLDCAFAPVELSRNLLEDQLRALIAARQRARAEAEANAKAKAEGDGECSANAEGFTEGSKEIPAKEKDDDAATGDAEGELNGERRENTNEDAVKHSDEETNGNVNGHTNGDTNEAKDGADTDDTPTPSEPKQSADKNENTT